MAPKHIGAWLLKRWPLAGGVLLIVAFVAGLAIGSSASRGIRAQAEPTPVVITEETMHLLPPFDPNAIPTMVPPPCAEKLKRKYDSYHYFGFGYGSSNCWLTLGDRNITEAQADEYIAKREAEKSEQAAFSAQTDEAAAFRAELALIRTIKFYDGTKVELPDDVRIEDYTIIDPFCEPGTYCFKSPQYRLVRGDSVVWVDGRGNMMSFMDDMPEEIDPSAFPFLTKRAPEGCC